MLAHGGVEEAELLNDGGDGVGVGVLVGAVGPLPEARRLHAGNPLEALVLQHPRDCQTRMSALAGEDVTTVRLTNERTDGRSELLLHHGDELMVDVDGEVAQDLPVLGQIEVLQAVLLLARRALLHELLTKKENQVRLQPWAWPWVWAWPSRDAPPRRCTASDS